jgi:signal transduction histidine kinase
MNQPRATNEFVAYRRLESRLTLLWTGLTYATTALGLWGVFTTRPELLQGWPLVALAVLLAAFFLNYHLVLLRAPANPSVRWVVGYGLPQAVIFATLFHVYAPEFLGLGIALVIQLMSALPVRYWPVPIGGLVVFVTISLDLIGEAQRGNTSLVLLVATQIGLWTGLFAIVLFVLRQQERLAELVEELRVAQEQLRRAAVQANELATLRERTRLAREMHDSLGHALVTVNVKLEVVERLYARDAERGVAELRATRDLVRQAMVDLRHSLDDLRGPVPSRRDLPVDMQRRLAEFHERTRIMASGEVDPGLPDLPPAIVAALWATLQESLRNVERHAGAASVEVSLTRDGEWLKLRVADDGTGLTPGDLTRPGRHGITGMRERIEEHGGSLLVTTRPGGGTVVEATLPLAPATGSAPGPGEGELAVPGAGDEAALVSPATRR